VTESRNRGRARDNLDRAGQGRERRNWYFEENAKRCVKKKERKTEQWEDKSSYIHRSSSSDITLNSTKHFLSS
jgi:hypothetical protein